MRRLAIVFAMIAMLSPVQLAAPRLASAVYRVYRFIQRQMKLLPRFAGTVGLLHD